MALMPKYAFRDTCTIENAVLDHVAVSGPCYSCGKPQTVFVKKADLDRFRNGEFAQDCFPYLPAGEREFLISGICDSCWDEMFPSEDDDDDG